MMASSGGGYQVVVAIADQSQELLDDAAGRITPLTRLPLCCTPLSLQQVYQ